MNHQRSRSLSLSFFICFSLITVRIAYWQIVQGPSFHRLVLRQSYQLIRTDPEPGIIFSQDNFPLVLNQHFYSLSIYKPDLQISLEQILNNINRVVPEFTAIHQSQLEKFVTNPKIKWQTFNTDITPDQKSQLTLAGLAFQPKIKKFYPEGTAIGYLLGLEKYYRQELRGRPGFSLESKNALGQSTLTKKKWFLPPQNGHNLYTTINRSVQYIAHESLSAGITQYSADSGSVTIIRPQDGAVIAISSFSSPQASSSSQSIANISRLFEPGSIFKPLVVAMALDHQSIDTNYLCTQCSRPRTIGEYTITNWDNSLHPNSPLKDIIKNSDNVGMSYIISQLGQNSFLKYFRSLKLDSQSNVDLAGEATPLTKKYWSEIDLATASFGQGFATTQINMLAAFSVLANNGFLAKPYLVHFTEDQGHTNPVNQPPPQPIFKPATIDRVVDILKYATTQGVVAKFKPANLEVCGKSGTAQVAISGHYDNSSAIASYIGFTPCQNPKFAMIVTINNPKTSPWGSSTAAPVWFDIATKISPLL